MSGPSLAQKGIKVERTKLIDALESALKRDDGGYERQKAAYVRAVDKAIGEILAQIEKGVDVAARVKNRNSYGGYPLTLELASKTKIPEKPRDANCELRNTIAVLKMSNEPTVSLSADQYARYFPCPVDDDE